MKLVITGANGSVGRALLRAMFGAHDAPRAGAQQGGSGFEVHALLRSVRSQQEMARDFPQVRTHLVGGSHAESHRVLSGAHAVVHLAWSTVPVSANNDPALDQRANLASGLQLLEACGRVGIGRFVFISSGGTVYGAGNGVPHREGDPLDPIGAYGNGKACMEHYVRLRSAHHGYASTILRPANLYGSPASAKKDQGVVEHWMDLIHLQRPIEVWNGFNVVRDFVHIDDMVHAILATLGPNEQPAVLNVGTGVGTSLAQLREMLFAIAGNTVPAIDHGAGVSALPWNVLDPTLSRTALGGGTHVPLQVGLLRSWQSRYPAR